MGSSPVAAACFPAPVSLIDGRRAILYPPSPAAAPRTADPRRSRARPGAGRRDLHWLARGAHV